MIAHLLSTGDEVLLGDVTDTNASFLARQLKNAGIRVRKTTTVGDDIEEISQAMNQISGQAQICIATGGLGPTVDDLSAQACARAAGMGLEIDRQALDSMAVFYQRRGFEMTQGDTEQAMLPQGAKVLVNDHGTAPGFYIQIHDCLFFFLPGVPSEMKAMFKTKVLPVLKEQFKMTDLVLIERLTIFGLGESKVGADLEGFEKQFHGLTLGFRARFPVVEVKIVGKGEIGNKNEIQATLKKAVQWAVDKLEGKVVSTKGLSVAEEVGRLLVEQNKTLAVAESCTGGLIANMMTDLSGSSDYFLFSGVTYSNDAKVNVLGVKQQTLIEVGAVHEKIAEQMAYGAKKKAGSDVAISTTGIAGPTGGSKEKPVGMVCIGMATENRSMAKTFVFPFEDRLMNKKVFAATALEMLRQYLVSGNQLPRCKQRGMDL